MPPTNGHRIELERAAETPSCPDLSESSVEIGEEERRLVVSPAQSVNAGSRHHQQLTPLCSSFASLAEVLPIDRRCCPSCLATTRALNRRRRRCHVSLFKGGRGDMAGARRDDAADGLVTRKRLTLTSLVSPVAPPAWAPTWSSFHLRFQAEDRSCPSHSSQDQT